MTQAAQDPTGSPAEGELEALRQDNMWWKSQAATLDAASKAGDMQTAADVLAAMYGFDDPSLILEVNADRSVGTDRHFAVGVDLGTRHHVLGVPRSVSNGAQTKLGGLELANAEAAQLLEWLRLCDEVTGGVDVLTAHSAPGVVYLVHDTEGELTLHQAKLKELLAQQEPRPVIADAWAIDLVESTEVVFNGPTTRLSQPAPIMTFTLAAQTDGHSAVRDPHFYDNGVSYALTPLDFSA